MDNLLRVEQDYSDFLALMNTGRMKEARVLIQELAVKYPDHERIQHYAVVIAPPKARSIPKEEAEAMGLKPHPQAMKLISQEAHKHPGCWLAASDEGELLTDPSLKDLMETLRAREDGQEFVLWYEPTPEGWQQYRELRGATITYE